MGPPSDAAKERLCFQRVGFSAHPSLSPSSPVTGTIATPDSLNRFSSDAGRLEL